MILQFKKELTYGHILTTVSVLISLVTLMYSWGESRKINEREQANKIRNAASITLGKVHRWEKICYSFFEITQPIYVETSEILVNERDYEKARDYLWKSLNRAKMQITSQIMKEEIEFSYINLYAYNPEIRAIFIETTEKMRAYENKMLAELLEKTQEGIKVFERKIKEEHLFYSADVGNLLRDTSAVIRDNYKINVQKVLSLPITHLEELVLKNDRELLSK